ncbi:hypothetical protein EYD10_03942 [Varanus komodoensis]|nr:hypothetical protein EYD10_03942 [Varanus komodoensis]
MGIDPRAKQELCVFTLILLDSCKKENCQKKPKPRVIFLCKKRLSVEHPCHGHDPFWVIRYGVIYNLVILRSELTWVVNREGLRNAVWRTLQKQKDIEKESRVLNAAKVAEAFKAGSFQSQESLVLIFKLQHSRTKGSKEAANLL